MKDMHGLIYTLRSDPTLGELVAKRNSASIPFCGRYRIIDFILSGMVDAGILDVGVIMERDYQSLLDHLGSGKDWDLARRRGGLRLLPPFGLPESYEGRFDGCMEALKSVRSYIDDIPQPDIVLSAGDLVANIDLTAVADLHRDSGAEMTAVCAGGAPHYPHHRLVPDADGFARRLISVEGGPGEGLVSLEVYIIKKSLLLDLMDYCAGTGRKHFHRDAVAHYLAGGGRVAVYEHKGYARRIYSALDYYQASMDMLQLENMAELFPKGEQLVRTKERAEVSTYYGEEAAVRNCLVADGCYIEGTVEDCILFRGVHVEKGAVLRRCVIMQDTAVGRGAQLKCAIADKDVTVGEGVFLAGSERLPIIIPKGAVL
jgi:glucose-1-phosphate adenylyltransferase